MSRVAYASEKEKVASNDLTQIFVKQFSADMRFANTTHATQ